ncbi:hypothetical protein [Amycolatopsis sp. DSM 110486]|uniref:hypothetical protein n=1 Tax=Amycolatopsis sp. DSM 110486 TaxID=2865832 RepID=UPI00210744C0|nr:hypothetical protein [Amycolatopsis sp. DSM 110486]
MRLAEVGDGLGARGRGGEVAGEDVGTGVDGALTGVGAGQVPEAGRESQCLDGRLSVGRHQGDHRAVADGGARGEQDQATFGAGEHAVEDHGLARDGPLGEVVQLRTGHGAGDGRVAGDLERAARAVARLHRGRAVRQHGGELL